MFGIKTYFRKKYLSTDKFFPSRKQKKIPLHPAKKIYLAYLLFLVIQQLKHNKKWQSLNNLFCYPHPSAIKIWSKMLQFNPNHLGNWSIKGKKLTRTTTYFEKNVIDMMINLLKANKEQLEGYITSGGTEGNIYSAWLGRKYLERRVGKDSICLIRNDLTHYSIRKAADIIGIKDFITPINLTTWSTDIASLENTIKKAYTNGFHGFLIPLTLGYTVGGINDDIEGIILKIKMLKRQFKSIHFFIWIDAALSGFVLPFIHKKFNPFQNNLIQTIIIDLHKFGGVPYPSGCILYRSSLRHLIEHPIPYLPEKDNTLLGSRTGIPAVAIWTMLHTFGKKGFIKEIKKCQQRKDSFLQEVVSKFPETTIINEPLSIQTALIVPKRLPEEFEKRFGLKMLKFKIHFTGGIKEIFIYKLFFMPEF